MVFFVFGWITIPSLIQCCTRFKKEDKEKVFKDILMDYINAPKTKVGYSRISKGEVLHSNYAS
jgi:hypothetical protein